MSDECCKKMEAAHDMVSALCLPRGSKGSREWIMSIPARPEHDPDLVITDGLLSAKKRIRDLESQLAAANATLDRLREIVPEDAKAWCAHCNRAAYFEPDLLSAGPDEWFEMCDECETAEDLERSLFAHIRAALYPKGNGE